MPDRTRVTFSKSIVKIAYEYDPSGRDNCPKGHPWTSIFSFNSWRSVPNQ